MNLSQKKRRGYYNGGVRIKDIKIIKENPALSSVRVLKVTYGGFFAQGAEAEGTA